MALKNCKKLYCILYGTGSKLGENISLVGAILISFQLMKMEFNVYFSPAGISLRTLVIGARALALFLCSSTRFYYIPGVLCQCPQADPKLSAAQKETLVEFHRCSTVCNHTYNYYIIVNIFFQITF